MRSRRRKYSVNFLNFRRYIDTVSVQSKKKKKHGGINLQVKLKPLKENEMKESS